MVFDIRVLEEREELGEYGVSKKRTRKALNGTKFGVKCRNRTVIMNFGIRTL